MSVEVKVLPKGTSLSLRLSLRLSLSFSLSVTLSIPCSVSYDNLSLSFTLSLFLSVNMVSSLLIYSSTELQGQFTCFVYAENASRAAFILLSKVLGRLCSCRTCHY